MDLSRRSVTNTGDSESGELRDRGYAGERAGTGQRQEPRAGRAGQGGVGNSREIGRIAEHGKEIRYAGGAGVHFLAGSAPGVQPGAEDDRRERLRGIDRTVTTSSEAGSEFCDGLRGAGDGLQRYFGAGHGRRIREEGLRIARPGERA